jgi:uncharacterized protein
MLYAIVGEDNEDSLDARMENRPAHLARITMLMNEGRLILAGPCPAVDCDDPGTAGFSGSLIVAEFSSLADAISWANADPYITGGVFKNVSVKPFKKVLP